MIRVLLITFCALRLITGILRGKCPHAVNGKKFIDDLVHYFLRLFTLYYSESDSPHLIRPDSCPFVGISAYHIIKALLLSVPEAFVKFGFCAICQLAIFMAFDLPSAISVYIGHEP